MTRKSTRVDMITLHPAPGRRVRHKDGRLFGEAGEEVPASSFYLRKQDAGDLLPGKQPKTARKNAKPGTQESANPKSGTKTKTAPNKKDTAT